MSCGRCGYEHPPDHPCHTWARPRQSWPSLEMVFGTRLEPGTLVEGRFRIHAVLDRRHGITRYAAHHLPLSRAVWLEVLDPTCAVDARMRQRFVQGVKLATRLTQHSGIAPVFDFGDVVQEGVACPFVVVPHQQGQSLAQRVEERGRASVRECIDVLDPLLDALKHAHSLGVVHRRVCPTNIWLVPTRGAGETTRLTGFGTSGLVGSTRTETLVAAGPTIAPELLRGKSVDGRADLYAVAATAFMMLTGDSLFSQALGQRELVDAILDAPPPSARFSRRDVPRGLDAWVRRGLSKNPSDRFVCAEDMRIALHDTTERFQREARPTEPARQSTR